MSEVEINRDNLRYILSLAKGRKFIWELLGVSGFMQNPFQSESQRITDFGLGNKNTAILLFAECMEASPDLTAMMLKEQGNDDKLRASSNSKPVERKPDAGTDRSSDGSGSDDHLDPGGLGFDRSGGRLIPGDE